MEIKVSAGRNRKKDCRSHVESLTIKSRDANECETLARLYMLITNGNGPMLARMIHAATEAPVQALTFVNSWTPEGESNEN